MEGTTPDRWDRVPLSVSVRGVREVGWVGVSGWAWWVGSGGLDGLGSAQLG